MSTHRMFTALRKHGTQLLTVKQHISDFPGVEQRAAYRSKTSAFREWQYKLKRGDKLPRGKFFKGKKAGMPLIILDEFPHYAALQNK